MPVVTIKIIEGRTIEQKRGLARDVTGAIVKNIGCRPEDVNISITDMKPENYAEGGRLFSDGR